MSSLLKEIRLSPFRSLLGMALLAVSFLLFAVTVWLLPPPNEVKSHPNNPGTERMNKRPMSALKISASNRLSSVFCSLGLLAATGCQHLGPRSVAVDRFDYSTAIADSWKQQTLLNIVKLRYMDFPVFVDVASVVSGYSMQTGVSVNGTLSSTKAIQGDFASMGGQAIYTDRPTITYVPATGDKFLRGLITPIDPKNIFFLLQSGYAADFILGMAVESLNGGAQPLDGRGV